jgi:hypothetical protein
MRSIQYVTLSLSRSTPFSAAIGFRRRLPPDVSDVHAEGVEGTQEHKLLKVMKKNETQNYQYTKV